MLSPEERDMRGDRTEWSRRRRGRLAQVIHSYRQALQAHPELQGTHEACLEPPWGGRGRRDYPFKTPPGATLIIAAGKSSAGSCF